MIGVIADDLTGAAEVGAVGLRHGLRAEIVMRDEGGAREFCHDGGEVVAKRSRVSESSAAPDLICVDTDSRSCTAEEAARRVAAAAKMLRGVGADWIYKKVDSVLRGQVTAELEAIMKELGLRRALLAPANPSLGRTIESGRYFVHGQPIQKTEFVNDPEHPRTSANVLKLIHAPSTFPVQVCGIKSRLPAVGVVVCGASCSADLQYWAGKRTPKTLVAGGAEFFGALLREGGRATETALPEGTADSTGDRELFICGTTSKSARDFVAAERSRRTPIFSLPAELAWNPEFSRAAMEAVAARVMAALHSQSRVILNVGLPTVRDPAKARLLALHLVELGAAVLQQSEVGHVYAEGGATAVALMRRMNWHQLSVLRELAPGVATLAVKGEKSTRLTIKPGSYVWPAAVQEKALMTPAAAV